MKKRFRVLRFISAIYIFAGVLIFVIGAGLAVLGILTNAALNTISGLLIALAGLFIALFLIANAETAELVMTIEENTRKTNDELHATALNLEVLSEQTRLLSEQTQQMAAS